MSRDYISLNLHSPFVSCLSLSYFKHIINVVTIQRINNNCWLSYLFVSFLLFLIGIRESYLNIRLQLTPVKRGRLEKSIYIRKDYI